MGRKYKMPSRRRLKKWRSRVERLAYSKIGRRGFAHWFNELLNCTPLIDAAKRVGVDLLDQLPKPEKPMEWNEVREMLYRVILGRPSPSPWSTDLPSRENLEI
jgi:hypothetical protein